MKLSIPNVQLCRVPQPSGNCLVMLSFLVLISCSVMLLYGTVLFPDSPSILLDKLVVLLSHLVLSHYTSLAGFEQSLTGR